MVVIVKSIIYLMLKIYEGLLGRYGFVYKEIRNTGETPYLKWSTHISESQYIHWEFDLAQNIMI